jgi:hypothetical protein
MRLLLLVLLAVTACSTTRSDPELDGMHRFKARMCGCHDRTCADSVEADYDAWGKTIVHARKLRTSEAQARDRGSKIDALEADLRTCKRAARRS